MFEFSSFLLDILIGNTLGFFVHGNLCSCSFFEVQRSGLF